MTHTRVMLADDHTLMRAGVRALLEDLEGVEVVAEAADGPEALAMVEAHRPDVLLADIAMPGFNGLDLTARLAEARPEVKVIILSMYHDEEYVRRAVLAGAKGYLLKTSDPAELGLAIRAVMSEGTYLSPAVSKHLVADYLRQAAGGAGPAAELTPRQREVLRRIAQGQSTKAIARTLAISVKTVETHRTQLMERLDIHEVAGLVRYAIRVGLISPDR